jgi:hypothetical protein
LLDTFAGFPDDQRGGLAVANDYFDTYDLVRTTFAEYPNVVVIRGAVPDTLPLVPSERIAYLCIDMNAAHNLRPGRFWPHRSSASKRSISP